MDGELDEFKEFYFTIKPALIRVVAQEKKLKLDDYKARKGFIINALNDLDLGQNELSDLYCDYLINVSESIYIYQLDIFEYVEQYFIDPNIIGVLQDTTRIKNMLCNNAKPKSIRKLPKTTFCFLDSFKLGSFTCFLGALLLEGLFLVFFLAIK